jgi:hypothetical protein
MQESRPAVIVNICPLVGHKIEINLTIFFLGQRKAWHSSVSFLLVAIRANTWSYVASAEQYEILKQIYCI